MSLARSAPLKSKALPFPFLRCLQLTEQEEKERMTRSEALIKILLSCPEGLTITAQGRKKKKERKKEPLFTRKKLRFSRFKQLLNPTVNSTSFGMRPLTSCVTLGKSFNLSGPHFLQL